MRLNDQTFQLLPVLLACASGSVLAGQDAIGELIRYVGGREAIAARDRIAVLEGLSLGPASQQGE